MTDELDDTPTSAEHYRLNLVRLNKVLDLLGQAANTPLYLTDPGARQFATMFDNKLTELYLMIMGQMKFTQTNYEQMTDEEITD